MKITKEKLQQLFALNDETTRYKELASDQLKTIKDQFGKRIIKVKRNGQKLNLVENVLWQEVFYAGGQPCQAAEILKEKYPDVFAASDHHGKLAADLKMWILKNLGVDFTQMSFVDYIKLTMAIVEYKNENPGHEDFNIGVDDEKIASY